MGGGISAYSSQKASNVSVQNTGKPGHLNIPPPLKIPQSNNDSSKVKF